jgi:branched-chain amino acid transport system ATP-binding protein
MALQEVSLSVERGERRAIIGPNGAGKTTLFNLLSGELAPAAGRIYLDDQDITSLPVHRRVQLGVGRTFQRNSLFPNLTVFENVRLAVQSRARAGHRPFVPVDKLEGLTAETNEIVGRFDLTAEAESPAGYLSYGVQRQLEVALALATASRVLLLDEPTAGMSPAETLTMTALIRDLPRDITLLIIEHDMDVVFGLADRVTVLHYGKVIAEGTPLEIRNDPGVMEVYLGVADNHSP